jgi:ribonuclease T1
MKPAQLRSLRTALVVLGCVAVLALWWWANQDSGAQPDSAATPRATQSQTSTVRGDTGASPSTRPGGTVAPRTQEPQPDQRVIAVVRESALPAEGRETLDRIRAGGPFPYERDGATFQNREGLLPQHPSGFYREYTVPTPGEEDRGARRIVTGKDAAKYYTDDHYDSFRLIREGS